MPTLDDLEARIAALEAQIAFMDNTDPLRQQAAIVTDDPPWRQPETDDYPWPVVPFGYTYTGATFTLKAGDINYADQSIAVAETPVTVSADRTYIYVRMQWGGTTATIMSDTTKPVSDGTYYRKWLYLVGFASGAITGITGYGNGGGGNIEIPAGFAKAP